MVSKDFREISASHICLDKRERQFKSKLKSNLCVFGFFHLSSYKKCTVGYLVSFIVPLPPLSFAWRRNGGPNPALEVTLQLYSKGSLKNWWFQNFCLHREHTQHKDFLSFYSPSFLWSYYDNYIIIFHGHEGVFWSYYQNFLSWECSRPLITFTALCWTRCGMSTSFLYWGARNWTQCSRCASPVLSKGEGSPPLTY